MNINDKITVLVSSSPIPSHPSMQIIQETLDSIRWHLPTARIIIMQDGIRPEQEDRKVAYSEYLKNLVAKIATGHDCNITIWPFIEFTHQALMTIKTLTQVRTPLIFFAEQDTPLVERPVEWDLLAEVVESGIVNHVRLHYDETIHGDHQHMMRGHLTPFLIKCVQYHNRPFLANAEWFQELLEKNFTSQSRTWIEDKVYSPISYEPWEQNRLAIYDPERTGQNMKRSRDLDGRAGDRKYDPIF